MSNKDTNDGQATNNSSSTFPAGTGGDSAGSGDLPVGDVFELGTSNQGDSLADEDAPWNPIDAGFSEEFQESQRNTEKAVLRLADNAAAGEEGIRAARQEPDLVKRIKAIRILGGLDFPEVKTMQSGGMQVTRPISSDVNMCVAFDALFGHELPERPHFDSFRGRTIGHNGLPIDGDFPVRDLLVALSSVQLEGLGMDKLRSVYRNWVGECKMNDLEHRFTSNLPEWDGKNRMTSMIIDLMKCNDTELNRAFSKYFWLSIYNRVTDPGCYAPMVLSLFGVQHCGKSYMSKRICELVVGKGADAVELDLAAIGSGQFIRQITGASVIANVGEMAGFTRGDLNKIKGFITKTVDPLDWKYESHKQQPRQWVIVMDGNKYDGLQRDETGNRRFYPMFCGQVADVMGQPAWASDFKADFTNFDEDFWQVMAECKRWMEARGKAGYKEFVDAVSKGVQEFSEYEMKSDRGTIKDENLDAYLPTVLLHAPKAYVESKRRKPFVFIKTMDILEGFARYKERPRVIPNHLKLKLAALGGAPGMWQNVRGYEFDCYDSIADFKARLTGTGSYSDVGDEVVAESDPGIVEGDGF